MSLIESSLWEVVRSQYFYKLKSHLSLFSALIGMQVLALLFSLGGVMNFGMGSRYLNVNISYFSSEMVFWFTALWIVVVSFVVTTKDYWDMDFTFISNRLSGNLSNIAFLSSAALIGGTSAIFSGFLLRLVVYLKNGGNLWVENFMPTPEILFIGVLMSVFYLLLFSSLGYLCGALVQLSKAFIILLVGSYFGSIWLVRLNPTFFLKIYDFYHGESSLPLFALKAVFTAGLLYLGSLFLSNRLEVR